MRKRSFLRSVALAALSCCPVVAVAAEPGKKSEPIGRVTAAFGDAHADTASGARPLNLQALVNNDERITTNGGGVSVLLASRVVMKIDANTAVSVFEGPAQTNIRVERGTVHVYVGKRPASAGPVMVSDMNGTIEATEGVFLVHTDAQNNQSYFACEHSQIRLSPANAGNQSSGAPLQLAADQQAVLRDGKLISSGNLDRVAFNQNKTSLDRLEQAQVSQGAQTFRLRSRAMDTEAAISSLSAAGWITRSELPSASAGTGSNSGQTPGEVQVDSKKPKTASAKTQTPSTPVAATPAPTPAAAAPVPTPETVAATAAPAGTVPPVAVDPATPQGGVTPDLAPPVVAATEVPPPVIDIAPAPAPAPTLDLALDTPAADAVVTTPAPLDTTVTAPTLDLAPAPVALDVVADVANVGVDAKGKGNKKGQDAVLKIEPTNTSTPVVAPVEVAVTTPEVAPLDLGLSGPAADAVTPKIDLSLEKAANPVKDAAPKLDIKPDLIKDTTAIAAPSLDLGSDKKPGKVDKSAVVPDVSKSVTVAPKVEAPKIDLAPKVDAPKVDTSVTAPPKVDAPIVAPKVEVPIDVAPKIDIAPKVDVAPKIDVTPKVDLAPKVDVVPKVEAPIIDLPAPKVEVPVDVAPPKVDIAPKIEAPKIDAPAIDLPPPKVDVAPAPVEVPKVDLPKVDVPKVDAPADIAPKVEVPTAPIEATKGIADAVKDTGVSAPPVIPTPSDLGIDPAKGTDIVTDVVKDITDKAAAKEKNKKNSDVPKK